VRKCQKLREKKPRNADVGEEAMVLAVKRGFEQAQAKANKPSALKLVRDLAELFCLIFIDCPVKSAELPLVAHRLQQLCMQKMNEPAKQPLELPSATYEPQLSASIDLERCLSREVLLHHRHCGAFSPAAFGTSSRHHRNHSRCRI